MEELRKDVKGLSVQVSKINVVLARLGENMEEHMRRTKASEHRLEIVEGELEDRIKYVEDECSTVKAGHNQIKGALKAITIIGVMGGIILKFL